MNWIPIDEKLPKEEKQVLIIDEDKNIMTGSYEIKSDGSCWRIGNNNVLWDFDYNLNCEVTHWMEEPEKI